LSTFVTCPDYPAFEDEDENEDEDEDEHEEEEEHGNETKRRSITIMDEKAKPKHV
jgi:hypothetical protein